MKSFLLLILSSIFISSSISDRVDDHAILLELIKEFNYKKIDSLCLKKVSTNEAALKFFKLRKRKVKVLYGFSEKDKQRYNKKKDNDINDSLIYFPLSTKIIDTIEVARDEYLKEGKGISSKAENFLNDSFNLKLDSLNWKDFPIERKIFIDKKAYKRLITISKPIYNQLKSKSIVFVNRATGSYTFEESIVFLEKLNGNWSVMYKQKEVTSYISCSSKQYFRKSNE